ncbi:ras-domain-containing protein [Cystobasidium minutum MCA 4210]|uniref:ras-domain-containing protein n=1 Tax=Cystobasidium minutum MCA 4210 TaxID=1397322 RepID=UPI0034CFF201|eukprot:jgi/Rhomi1/174302/fgenesh1_kg.7_\
MVDRDDVALVDIYDYLLKVVIIGESSTGKSCLLHTFLNGTFKNPSLHTVGVEFSSTLLKLPTTSPSHSKRSSTSHTETKTLKLQLWDTAGQERFRSVTRSYYRNAAGAIICYDITRRSSFEALQAWISDARALASPDLVIVLVGNKLDDEDNREVEYLEAARWAKENDLLFVEASALTGENVTQPFYLLARAILLAIESGRIDPERSNSGVSYGERSLRRMSSFGERSSTIRLGPLQMGRLKLGCC